jgi:cytosine/adenosine deaminase-related metal-dependent hydrolase
LRHDRVSTQEHLVSTAVGQLRAWLADGGMVLFGTDLGAVDPDPAEEYALMAEAGMSFRQILASLTTTPAERFGDSSRLGRIARGLQADLVVLNSGASRRGQRGGAARLPQLHLGLQSGEAFPPHQPIDDDGLLPLEARDEFGECSAHEIERSRRRRCSRCRYR